MGCSGSKGTKAVVTKKPESEATLLPEKEQEKQAEAPKGPAVKVTVVGARGLRNADCVGTSQPYCAVQLVGPKPESRLETKTHENYKDPAWNAVLEVPGYNRGDALSFTVKDKDPFKLDDILGKVVLTAAQVKDGFDGELPLTEAGEGLEAFIKVKVAAMGTVTAKVEQAAAAVKEAVAGKESAEAEEAKRPAVKVEIVSARGLRNADWVGTSEPYCVVELVGPKLESRLKTQTHESYQEPVWNAELEVPGYSPGDALSFTVKDKDTLTDDDLLGKVVLTEAQVREGFEGELQLTETGGQEAFIKVQVAAMGAIAAEVEIKEEIKKEMEEAGGPAVDENQQGAVQTVCCF